MALTFLRRSRLLRLPDFTSPPTRLALSSRFSSSQTGNADCSTIETVDDDAWLVSSSLSQAWRESQPDSVNHPYSAKTQARETSINDPDHDEIDNMRIRGDLFYKLDRGSKEFDEYNYDFHRKNHKTNKEHNPNKQEEAKNSKQVREEYKKRDEPKTNAFIDVRKRERTFTFNQLTAPYHYPFCLDIYISKASVRACVIHRVTSKVVTVAHSISKDMKFDLGSTRNAAACAAVGAVVAQRTLEEDIHDVVYTPRKGDKVEGKLQVVLQAIIDSGVNVKVKLKQRKLKKKMD